MSDQETMQDVLPKTATTPVMTLLWSRSLEGDVLSIAAGYPFSAKGCQVLTGSDNGIIYMFSNGTEKPLVFETKGGPVCQLLLHNVTKLHTADLVAGDSCGSVLLFAKEQLLSRAQVPYRVTALTVCEDGLQNNVIVAGDAGGTVIGFLPFERHWRIDFGTQMTNQGSLSTTRAAFSQDEPACIKALVNVQFADETGCPTHYLAVADSSKYIHFVQDGLFVFSLEVPCPPNAMCFGHFYYECDADSAEEPNEIKESSSSTERQINTRPGQLVCAGSNGDIYLVHNYKVHHYASIGSAVTQLLRLPWDDGADLLVCAGAFDGVKLVYKGQVTLEHHSSDWVYCMTQGDLDDDGQSELVLGLANRTLEAWKLAR